MKANLNNFRSQQICRTKPKTSFRSPPNLGRQQVLCENVSNHDRHTVTTPQLIPKLPNPHIHQLFHGIYPSANNSYIKLSPSIPTSAACVLRSTISIPPIAPLLVTKPPNVFSPFPRIERRAGGGAGLVRMRNSCAPH